MATLTGSNDTSSSNVNITTIGTVDWIHWTDIKGIAGSTQRKSGGGSLISDYSDVVPSDDFWNGAYDASTMSWSDGTPTASGSDTGVVYSVAGGAAGFTFTIPAGTSVQHADFYFGCVGSGVVFTATLSDASAGPYTATTAAGGDFNVHLDFSAGSAGQTLTITWVSGNVPYLRGIALSSSAPPATTDALFFGAGV